MGGGFGIDFLGGGGGGGTPTGTPYEIAYFDSTGNLSSIEGFEYFNNQLSLYMADSEFEVYSESKIAATQGFHYFSTALTDWSRFAEFGVFANNWGRSEFYAYAEDANGFTHLQIRPTGILLNDTNLNFEAVPGNNHYWGTNSAGVWGLHELTGGGATGTPYRVGIFDSEGDLTTSDNFRYREDQYLEYEIGNNPSGNYNQVLHGINTTYQVINKDFYQWFELYQGVNQWSIDLYNDLEPYNYANAYLTYSTFTVHIMDDNSETSFRQFLDEFTFSIDTGLRFAIRKNTIEMYDLPAAPSGNAIWKDENGFLKIG